MFLSVEINSDILVVHSYSLLQSRKLHSSFTASSFTLWCTVWYCSQVPQGRSYSSNTLIASSVRPFWIKERCSSVKWKHSGVVESLQPFCAHYTWCQAIRSSISLRLIRHQHEWRKVHALYKQLERVKDGLARRWISQCHVRAHSQLRTYQCMMST